MSRGILKVLLPIESFLSVEDAITAVAIAGFALALFLQILISAWRNTN